MNRARPRLNVPYALLLALGGARVLLGLRAARALLEPRFGDVGQWVDIGDRLRLGQVPFRDFGTLYGPLLLGWVGAGYALAGANWHAARLQLEVVSPALCLLLAYLVATRSFREPAWQILLLAAAAALGLDHFYWSPALRVWLPLCGLVFAARALVEGDDRSLAWACLLCGAGPWVSFETGSAAVLGAAILLVARLRAPGPRAAAVAAAALAAPSALMIAAFPGMSAAYGRALAALAGLTNWYGGEAFPLPGPDLETFCFYAPFLCVAGAGAAAALALGRARRREERARAAADLALAAFAAAGLRSLLGRSDDPHLLFALPAVVLLWLRACARRSAREPRGALLLAVLGLLPFLALGARQGERRPQRLPTELAAWPEEGLRADPDLIERSRLIVREIQRRVPADRSVLSLPLPLYAHLARRASALPANVPEQIAFGRGEPAEVVAAIESSRPALVVVDPALRLSLPQLDALLAAASPEPWDGRLTWSTAADEIISRELRAYLHARYVPAGAVSGAALYVRRPRPLPPRPEAVAVRVAAPSRLELGRGYALRAPWLQGRELRFDVRCSYAPGLGSLAKTYALVGYREESGQVRTAILPVPPARLGRDLRLPLPRARLKNVYIQVISPGAFNPAPRAIELGSIVLIPR